MKNPKKETRDVIAKARPLDSSIARSARLPPRSNHYPAPGKNRLIPAMMCGA